MTCNFSVDSAVSYINAVLVEAVLNFLGMDEVFSTPTLHCPPVSGATDSQFNWVCSTLNARLNTMLQSFPPVDGKYIV